MQKRLLRKCPPGEPYRKVSGGYYDAIHTVEVVMIQLLKMRSYKVER